jgi:hypothetical protein
MTNPTKPRPTFLALPADKPITVVFNTGEIKTIHVLSDGAAGWSWDRYHGLQYAVKVLPSARSEAQA